MLLYGATMFLGAFLLFLIQPMIGKFILPWFGGAPAVWTACMLFFQALLLGGYWYAHVLASRWSLRRQALFHLSLMIAIALAVVWFSIVPSQAWKPMDNGSPVLRILGLLLVTIGAPFFLLSTTSPLLQAWFSRTRPGSFPYRLYALSNLGSLLAIVSYPFVIEPEISLSRQASVFSWVYALFSLMCILLSLKVMASRKGDFRDLVPAEAEPARGESKPGLGRHLLWLSLTACGSVMLLATTSMLCQDLAVVPLLWILPLALYLLSFILCFQHERIYWRPLFIGGMAASITWTCFVLFGSVFVPLVWQILSYSITLFMVCMVCHGELVRLRPVSRHLTSFYLMVAAGGALGGLLVTVAAPFLLRGFWEYHFGLIAAVALTLFVLFRERSGLLFQGRSVAVWSLCGVIGVSWAALAYKLRLEIQHSWRSYAGLLGLALIVLAVLALDRRGLRLLGRPPRVWTAWAMLCITWVALTIVLGKHIQQSMDGIVDARRNFFGVLRVLELYRDYPEDHQFSLMHGRIEHGFQLQDKEMRHWPVSYYGPDSGIGQAMLNHPRRLDHEPMRIGVIGLGTGTMAAHGRQGDTIIFYEINPQVVQLSDKYFTYRRDSPARTEVVLGDARVSLERARQQGESREFDVLVVDAFSSDAIPVHLLTRECFEVYRYHLQPDGILAVHITNRYFDLSPVVRNLVPEDARSEMQALWFHDAGNASQRTDRTDWVLLTSNQRFLANPEVQRHVTPWNDPVPPPLIWTDDYSNLFSLIHERIDESQ
jgi:hypothetical protein